MALPNLRNPTDVPRVAVMHRARHDRPVRTQQGRQDKTSTTIVDSHAARCAQEAARTRSTKYACTRGSPVNSG